MSKARLWLICFELALGVAGSALVVWKLGWVAWGGISLLLWMTNLKRVVEKIKEREKEQDEIQNLE